MHNARPRARLCCPPFFRYIHTRTGCECIVSTRIYVTHCCEADLCVGGYAGENSSVFVCNKRDPPSPVCVHARFYSNVLPAVEGQFKLWDLAAGSLLFKSEKLSPRTDIHRHLCECAHVYTRALAAIKVKSYIQVYGLVRTYGSYRKKNCYRN